MKPDPAPRSAGASDDLTGIWKRVCDAAATNANDEALVSGLRLQSIDSGRVSLQTADARLLRYAEGRSERIAELFQEALGTAVRISVTAPKAQDAAPTASRRVSERDAEQIPLVQETMQLFNARVVSVEAASGPQES